MSPEQNRDTESDGKSFCSFYFILLCGAATLAISSYQRNARVDIASFPTPLSSPLPDDLSLRSQSQPENNLDYPACFPPDIQTQNTIEALTQAWPELLHPHIPCIVQYSAEYQLDPSLVAAVVINRSQGNSDQINFDGSTGLMGVMPNNPPQEHFCINGPCFKDRPSIEELLDPETNIKTGTKTLRQYIDYYGDIREALKHYGSQNDGYSFADNVLGIFEELMMVYSSL